MNYRSSIIDHLGQQQRQNSNIGLAYVYLNYSERGEQSVKNIVRSFVKQLIEIDNSAFQLLRKHSQDRRYTTKVGDINTQDAAQLLQDISNGFERVFLIVDAFDESQSIDTQRELSDLLRTLQCNCNQARILITLRPGSSEYLKNFKGAAEKIVNPSDTDRDIVQYVRHRMREGFLRRNIDRKPSLLELVVDTVSKKCAGMFLLGRLHMDSLALLRGLYHFETRLGQLSDQIEEAYNDTLKRLYDQEEENVKFAEQILEWVLNAVRPLKVDELLYALAVVDNDETDFDERRLYPREDIEDVCKGLVVIEQGSGEVQLVHHTAQEYFKRRAHELFPGAKETLAISCTRYLEYSRFTRSKEPRKTSDVANDNSFLRYAVENFGLHSKTAGDICTKRIVKLLRDIDHHDFITQVQFNSTHGRAGPAYTPLCTATLYNLPSVVRLLLETGENVNSRGRRLNLATHEAASSNKTDILNMLLQATPPPDLGRTDHIDNTFLHALAVGGNNPDIAREVLRLRSNNINHRNANGNTPLHDAISRGHLEIAKLLIEAGAELNISNNSRESPMHMAIYSRKPKQAVKLLLEAHHPNYIVHDEFGLTPLHAAAAMDFKDEIELLVQTCPGAIDLVHHDGGKSALHDAAEKGRPIATETLIKLGANVNLVDNVSATPLWFALAKKQDNIANMLLDAGADPSLDCPRWPLGHELARMSLSLKKRLLSDKRLNYAAANFTQVTGLHNATFNHWNEAALLYIEHDIMHGSRMMNAQNHRLFTPLMDAAEVGNTAIARRLVEVGVNVDLRDRNGSTALQVAIDSGHEELAEIIRGSRKKNVNVNSST